MLNYKLIQLFHSVIPTQVGTHVDFCSNYFKTSIKIKMDSRLRGNDE